MFFKNQKRNPFSAYRAFMSPYKWTSSVMACQTVVNLASRSNHFKCKQFDSLSFSSTPSKFCAIILMIFQGERNLLMLLQITSILCCIHFHDLFLVMKISLSQLGGGGNSGATWGNFWINLCVILSFATICAAYENEGLYSLV